jgi:hypothetical protein
MLVNLAFLVFNLLPVRTLDGGRILFAFLARRTGFIRASKIMGIVSAAVCGFIIAVGILQVVLYPPNITLFLLGIILIYQGKVHGTSEILSFTHSLIMEEDKYTDGRKLALRFSAFHVSTVVKDLLDSLDYDCLCIFYIYDTSNITTMLTEIELICLIREYGATGNLKSLLSDTVQSPE